MIEYKTDAQILREQIRTMGLKLEEVVVDVYNNLAPTISASAANLATEISKVKKENTKLQVQIDSLVEEKDKISELIARYHERLHTLENLIEG